MLRIREQKTVIGEYHQVLRQIGEEETRQEIICLQNATADQRRKSLEVDLDAGILEFESFQSHAFWTLPSS